MFVTENCENNIRFVILIDLSLKKKKKKKTCYCLVSYTGLQILWKSFAICYSRNAYEIKCEFFFFTYVSIYAMFHNVLKTVILLWSFLARLVLRIW